jgi:hypothetical protein
MWPAGNWSRKVREISKNGFGTTEYLGSVALESAVMDLDNRIIGRDSSALEVACGPPGIGAKKFQESSRRKQPVTTYIASSVALEYRVVDLHIGTIGINSTALEVACPTPGIGAKISDSFFGRTCSDGVEK